MERMLPKMYKDLLGIVSVLCMVLCPHQVGAESLCHLDFCPQPYSLEEEVGNLVWEYPRVHSQWKADRSETNVWKKPLLQNQQIQYEAQKSQQKTSRQPPAQWNSSQPEHRAGTQKSFSCLQLIGEVPQHRRRQQYVLEEEKAQRQPLARVELKGSKRRRLPGKKRSETRRQRSQQGKQRKQKKKSLKEPLRRHQFEGSSMLPWQAQAVLSRYFYSKGSIKHFSETHRTDRTSTSLSIGLSRTSDTYPVQYLAPRQGKKNELSLQNFGKQKKPRKLKLHTVPQKQKKPTKDLYQGSASLKNWKRRSVLEKKRALEEENTRKRKELEEESRRLKAVEEAERRAREQRARNPKVQVPVASEKEKQETWFERKATELVEQYIQEYGPQEKKSKEAAEAYSAACTEAERAQEDFISVLQKSQEKAEALQKSLGRALEAAVVFGREEERARLCSQAKDKCPRPKVPETKARPRIPAGLQKKLREEKAQQGDASKPEKKEESEVPTSTSPGPFYGVRARKQPAEEEPGKEWRERISNKEWKIGQKLEEGERFLEARYQPFSEDWQRKLRKNCSPSRTAASRRMRKENFTRLRSLVGNFAVLANLKPSTSAWNRTTDVDWSGKVRKSKAEANVSTTSIAFPLEGEEWIRSTSMESSTWYWEAYLQPRVCAPHVGQRAIGEVDAPSRKWLSSCGNRPWQCWYQEKKLRRYYPCRNIVCERYQDEKENDFMYYYPAVTLVDYGAVSSQVLKSTRRSTRKRNCKILKGIQKSKPPEDEREGYQVLSTEKAMEYAASKKAAKPSDPEQSMASHAEALLEMQDQAKKRRVRALEKESKDKAIDVDEESTGRREGSSSKKARGGKGQGSEGGALPPGHWQDRPKAIHSGSQEAKDALREKLDAHKKEEAYRKEQYEEAQKQKLRETIDAHFEKEDKEKKRVPEAAASSNPGPGPDEAGSDPSSSESYESTDSAEDKGEAAAQRGTSLE